VNVANRVLAFLVAVGLIAGGAGLAYASLLVPYAATAYVQAWAAYLGEQIDLTGRLTAAAIGGAAVLLGVFLLYLQLPSRTRATVKLRKIDGGSGVLSVGAISQRVQHDVEVLAEVRRAKPQIISKGHSVDIKLEIVTDPYVEAASKTEEVCRVIRENVEGRMGIRVGRIRVSVSHESIPKDSVAPKQPSAA
jgi:uncharacterized alkaline shock family protein YloU